MKKSFLALTIIGLSLFFVHSTFAKEYTETGCFVGGGKSDPHSVLLSDSDKDWRFNWDGGEVDLFMCRCPDEKCKFIFDADITKSGKSKIYKIKKVIKQTLLK